MADSVGTRIHQIVAWPWPGSVFFILLVSCFCQGQELLAIGVLVSVMFSYYFGMAMRMKESFVGKIITRLVILSPLLTQAA